MRTPRTVLTIVVACALIAVWPLRGDAQTQLPPVAQAPVCAALRQVQLTVANQPFAAQAIASLLQRFACNGGSGTSTTMSTTSIPGGTFPPTSATTLPPCTTTSMASTTTSLFPPTTFPCQP